MPRATYESADLGVLVDGQPLDRRQVSLELSAVNARVIGLARAQSDDIRSRLERDGVRIVEGRGVMVGPAGAGRDGFGEHLFDADVVLVATGARPRVLAAAVPDGERILTWEQVYALTQVPEHLIVVGSGVTGAEFASAYRGLGSEVTLVSSRDHVLPGQDADAAAVIEQAFGRRGSP